MKKDELVDVTALAEALLYLRRPEVKADLIRYLEEILTEKGIPCTRGPEKKQEDGKIPSVLLNYCRSMM